MTALLEVVGLEAFYGETRALHGCDFSVAQGAITTILGANGAGKTTTLRAISGMIRTHGEIRLAGKRIDGVAPEEIVRAGVGHVPDGRGTFTQFTVEENLRLGAYTRRDPAGVTRDFDWIYTLFPRLRERRRQFAGTLSGGEQQMLAIGRAMMSRPRLLLMDEPSFGLAPIIVREIFEIMRDINRQQGMSILLVEQNASMALDIAGTAYLLETGRVAIQGESRLIKDNPNVRRSYLGY